MKFMINIRNASNFWGTENRKIKKPISLGILGYNTA